LAAIICGGVGSTVIFLPLLVVGIIIGISMIKLMFPTPKANYGNGQIVINSVTQPSQNSQVMLTNNQTALVNYIRESKSKGVTTDLIFSVLKNNGWTEDEIRVAIGYAEAHIQIF